MLVSVSEEENEKWVAAIRHQVSLSHASERARSDGSWIGTMRRRVKEFITSDRWKMFLRTCRHVNKNVYAYIRKSDTTCTPSNIWQVSDGNGNCHHCILHVVAHRMSNSARGGLTHTSNKLSKVWSMLWLSFSRLVCARAIVGMRQTHCFLPWPWCYNDCH